MLRCEASTTLFPRVAVVSLLFGFEGTAFGISLEPFFGSWYPVCMAQFKGKLTGKYQDVGSNHMPRCDLNFSRY